MKTFEFLAYVQHKDRTFFTFLQCEAPTLKEAFETAKEEFALRYSYFEILRYSLIKY